MRDEHEVMGGTVPAREPPELLLFESAGGALDRAGEVTALPAAPRLRRDARGAPVVGATLLLAADPAPGDGAIDHLLVQASLALELEVAVDPAALVARLGGRPGRPAFARPAEFSIVDAQAGAVLARAEGSGPSPSAALAWQAGRDEALRFVAALHGAPSGLVARVDVRHAVAGPRRRLAVTGSWVDVWDALAARATAAPAGAPSAVPRTVDEAAVASAVVDLAAAGALRLVLDGAPVAAPELPGELSAALVRMVRRSGSVVLAPADPAEPGRWPLAERPDARYALAYQETLGGAREVVTRLAAPLEALLGGALEGRDWAGFVRLVSPEGRSGSFRATPRRARGAEQPVARRAPADAPVAMTAVSGAVMTTALAVSPGRVALRPSLLALSPALQHLDLDHLVAELGTRPVSLPVVESADAPLLRDRLSPSRWWYLPTLEPVPPDPAADPEQGAFLFRFERIGTTETGDAALRASVRVVLRRGMTQATREAIARLGGATASPVELRDPAVDLVIPFVDSRTGQPAAQALRGEVSVEGDRLVATFAVVSAWVRVAYGALSAAAGQGGAAPRLSWAYRYDCYRPLRDVRVVAGMKQALLPVKWGRAPDPAPDAPLHLEASRGLLQAGRVQVRLEVETAESVRREVAERAPALRPVAGNALFRPVKPARPVLLPRPPITDPVLPSPAAEPRYAREERAAAGAAELSVPCSRLGALYQELRPEGWRAVGCQESFRLGQIAGREYEELPELATSWYRVHRALAQPGRFLVLPRSYQLTRYPPGDERAYRPCALVYAVLDEDDPDDSRYTFVATVEPAIPHFAWRELASRLAAYAPPRSLALDLPVDVARRTELPAVTLASAVAPPRFAAAGAGLQVTLEARLADALVLRTALERTGVVGTLAFTLGDGARLESQLELHLASLTGPWGHGPLALERTTGGVRLRNRIERAVDLREVRLHGPGAAFEAVACERRLAPDEAVDVPLTAEGEPVAAFAVPPQAAATLEEARLFVEDVTFNVVFTCGVNFEARGLADLEVYARLAGDAAPLRVALQAGLPRIGEARLVAPISRVVEAGSPWGAVEYRAVRAMASGERLETPWRACEGAHVDLTWDLLVGS